MDRDQATTIESARESSERDVQEHGTTDQISRQQLNLPKPTYISSLPAEILLIIFSFVKSAPLKPQGWIKLSHVCTYWRQVAINSPGLWCEPPLANLPWTVEMLARSKQVDIILESNSYCYYASRDEGYEEASRHAARIRRISFDFSCPKEWLPRAIANLPVSAPRLETLSIDVDAFEKEALSIAVDTLVDVPNLRRLELSQCGPNWDAQWLPQITHFKLFDIVNPKQLTWARLMTALGKMHSLESLTLSNFIPPHTITSDELNETPPAIINLARLRVLTINEDFLVVESFFRCVTFSYKAAVHVDSFILEELPPEADGVHFASILRNIAKSRSNTASSDIIFKTLVVDYVETTSQLYFGIFDDIFEESADIFGKCANMLEDVKSDRRGLSLIFEADLHSTPASWFNAVFPGIFSAGLPLDDISHVHLRSQLPLEEHLDNPRLLAETVGLLPALSHIKISGRIAPCFMLAEFSHLDEDVVMPKPLLPPFARLESVHFYAVPFFPSNTRWKKKLGLVDRELLQRFLVMRSATRAPSMPAGRVPLSHRGRCGRAAQGRRRRHMLRCDGTPASCVLTPGVCMPAMLLRASG